ncbi:MAG: hypothetical protein AB8F74_08610 [Saprospiraceae bacterium]
MSKQNIGFIAPFALNILAYVLVWNFFFADSDTTTFNDAEVPAAFQEEVEPTEDGAYILEEDHKYTALREE